MWGVNYDHDGEGRLLEDYWQTEWETVVADFREIKDLGANVVRVHLQLGRFMQTPNQAVAKNLAQLGQLIELTQSTGLYLDITGLGCYHKQDIPTWYDSLSEQKRWEVQARFWTEVATVCKDSPAVFCYDLMNEPILPGEGKPETEWLAGELGGKYFVQRITLDLGTRTRKEVAQQWVEKLAGAIRQVDQRHLITVGVIPWAQAFPGAKPIFYAPEVSQKLDFVSVHFYPKKGKVPETLQALRVYEIGKPLVIEETFPLGCSQEELVEFINGSRDVADGWISFYWGTTIDQYESQSTLQAAIVAAWLKKFKELASQR